MVSRLNQRTQIIFCRLAFIRNALKISENFFLIEILWQCTHTHTQVAFWDSELNDKKLVSKSESLGNKI